MPENRDPANALVVLSETGSDHLHVIAEEVSRVAELCIGQDMGNDEHGHGIHGDGGRQRGLTVVITLTGNSFFCLIKRKVYAIT